MDDDSKTEKLSTFLAVAGCDDDVARQYLDSCNWDLDAAINTFLAGGGSGGGAAAGGAGGGPGGDMGAADAALAASLMDYTDEDEVRAPIAQTRGRLVDGPLYHHMAPGGAHGIGRGAGAGGRGNFEQMTHAKEAFRDFEQEASSLRAGGAGAAGGGGGGEGDGNGGEGGGLGGGGGGSDVAASMKPKNLAAIYRPPLELCFRGPFDELRAAGREEGKWLLVNIQSATEFASQQLNADTWRDEALRALLSASFVFWQQYHDSPLGSHYCRLYLPGLALGLAAGSAGGAVASGAAPAPVLPHIGILDPRTGELCKSLSGFQSAERLLDILIRFADRELQPMPAMPAMDDSGAGGRGGLGGAGREDEGEGGAVAREGAVFAPFLRSLRDDAGTGGPASAGGGEQQLRALGGAGPAGSAPMLTGAEEAAEEDAVDPSLDDSYWAAYPAGDEPAAGDGVVCLVVKMPDGSRSDPRHFELSATLGSVLSSLHRSGRRLPSARSWALVQPAPPRESLADLLAPLSSINVKQGKAMLILQALPS